MNLNAVNNNNIDLKAALTPMDDPTAEVMVYGALQAYKFDLAAGLTEEAAQAKAFLEGLKDKYSFSDGYTQKTLDDFIALGSEDAFKSWWNDLLTNGLISSDSTKPKLSLQSWIDTNSKSFNPRGLPKDNLLNPGNFTLYSDMFFMQLKNDKASFPETGRDIDSYFTIPSEGGANAGALVLQIYRSFNPPPEMGNSTWASFVDAVQKLIAAIDPSGQKTGTYLSLQGIIRGITPDPYNNFQTYFDDIEKGNVEPMQSSWSVYATYESDLLKEPALQYVSNEIAAFKAAAASGNDTQMHTIVASINSYLSSDPNGKILAQDAPFMSKLAGAIDLTKYSATWSLNTPNGKVTLPPGTAQCPPSTVQPAQYSYQMSFDNLKDFKKAMNNSSAYPGCIPASNQLVQTNVSGQGTVQNMAWNDFIQKVGNQSTYAQLFTTDGQSQPYAQYSIQVNPNGSVSVSVFLETNYSGAQMPQSMLNGYTTSIDINSNPALNDLINGYLPPPTS